MQFQLDTDDFEDFREDLSFWRCCGSFVNMPPPLYIEVYLDLSPLKPSETLVLFDSASNKRWEVVKALHAGLDSPTGTISRGSATPPKNATQVILERWRIELNSFPTIANGRDFGSTLPAIYKKAIVFMRSIFTLIHVTPSWHLVKKSRAGGLHPVLVPRCRIRSTMEDGSGIDYLRKPITMSGNAKSSATQEFVFGDIDVLVGRFYASVTYRTECGCNFRVDDSEAILSSQFVGVDENLFSHYVPRMTEGQPHRDGSGGGSGGGGLSSSGSGVALSEIDDCVPSKFQHRGTYSLQQTYRSLSTFHGDDPLGASPISAPLAARPQCSDNISPPVSVPRTTYPEIRHSLPSTFATISPFRGGDGHTRGTSISFQPFKGGPISTPLRPHDPYMEPHKSPQSMGRVGSVLSLMSEDKNRSSLTAGMPASLRAILQTQAHKHDPALGSSQRNTILSSSGVKYSSSFSHRRGRPSIGGLSKTGDDEQGSSGRQSLSSSVVHSGSGVLNEAPGASSGFLLASDDNIEDFLKVLDSRRYLKSFDPPKKGDVTPNRTVTQLNKFHLMQESNAALGESLTSSMRLRRPSDSSNVQLVSAVAITAFSSPGKSLSPHTPHTPAIPSRLSENSIIDHDQGQQLREVSQHTVLPPIIHSGQNLASTCSQDSASAVDIPMSPRIGIGTESSLEQPSSVARQTRAMTMEEDDPDPAFFPQPSLNLGSVDRESLVMGMFLRRPTDLHLAEHLDPQSGSAANINSMRHHAYGNQPPGVISRPVSSCSPFGSMRYVDMSIAAGSGAGETRAIHTGTSIFDDRGQISPRFERGRFAASGDIHGHSGYNEMTDEEPLVFDMSEMDAHVQCSLEDGMDCKAADDYRG